MQAQHQAQHGRRQHARRSPTVLAAIFAVLLTIALPQGAFANSGTPALSISSPSLTSGSTVTATSTTFDAKFNYSTSSTQAYTSGIQFQALGAGATVSGTGCTAFVDTTQFTGTCTQVNSTTARFCFATTRTEPLNQSHTLRIHGTWTTPTAAGPMDYSMWFYNSLSSQNCSSFTGPSTTASAAPFKSVPTAPATISATTTNDGSGTSTVNWSAANFNYGASDSYVLQRRGGGQDADINVGAVTSYTDIATHAGQSYTYYVYASNDVGNSGITGPSNTVIPVGPPAAPTNLTATATTGAKATISWTQPVNGQGAVITSYTISDGTQTYVTAGSPYTISGLVIGQSYRYSVAANSSNTAGATGCCTNTISAFDVPAAPTAPTASVATVHDHGAAVTWTAPASNNSPITSYRVVINDTTVNNQSTVVTGSTATSYTAGSLTNGHAYTFAVAAINAGGAGPTSAASNAVTPYGTPGAPASVTASPHDRSATITWTAPTNTNGAPVTGYTVTLTDSTTPSNGGQTYTGNASTLSCVLAGLTDGDSYLATVTATTAGGSASATSATFIPAGPPAAPAAPTVTAGLRQVAVSWTAPASNGAAITGYTVTATDLDTPGNGGQSCTAFSTNCTVTGLTPGDRYTFIVVATNTAGNSPPSPASVAAVPYAPPAAPTAPTATAGASSATVTWTAPAANGSPIGSYQMYGTDFTNSANSGLMCITADTSCIIGGLVAGDTYTFTIQAVNSAGSSPASPPSNAVQPYTVPDPPSSVTAHPATGSATITWTQPGSDGGSPITGYTVTLNDTSNTSNGGQTCTVTALTCTIAGLTNGDSYVAQVVASNAVGDSAPATSAAVTPIGVPAEPRQVTAVAQSSSTIMLTWQPPANTGGTPITGYTVSIVGGAAGICDGSTETSCLVNGLAPSTAYTFTVVATNAQGNSPAASSNPATTKAGGPPTCPPSYQIGPDGVSCVQITIGLSMNLNDQSLTLQGQTGSTISGPDNSLTYTVTTNDNSGYTVNAQAGSPTLTTSGTTDSIPFDALTATGVTGTFGLGGGGALYTQAAPSAPGGDSHRATFTARIPFVSDGTYSGFINFTALAN
jgi:hypothetical protein